MHAAARRRAAPVPGKPEHGRCCSAPTSSCCRACPPSSSCCAYRDALRRKYLPRLYRKLSLSLPELDIVPALNAAVSAHDSVTFGSYPVKQGDARTIIRSRPSGCEAELVAAIDALRASLPADAVLDESRAEHLRW